MLTTFSRRFGAGWRITRPRSTVQRFLRAKRSRGSVCGGRLDDERWAAAAPAGRRRPPLAPVASQLSVVADVAVARLHVAVEGELLVGRAAERVGARGPALAEPELVAAEAAREVLHVDHEVGHCHR